MPATKVIHGIPMYGYDWTAGSSWPQDLTWTDVKVLINQYQPTVTWDTTNKVSKFTYSSAGLQHTGWFENAASTSAKLDITKQQAVSGIHVWRLGGEDPATWNKVRSKFALNVAQGILPTSSSTYFVNPMLATDGSITTGDIQMNNGPQWVTIDLGQSLSLKQIKLWHYYADGRIYRDVIVQISKSATFSSGVKTVFNNDADNSSGQGIGTQAEYAETSAGKTISFSPVSARYIRLWSNGNSVNAYNHLIEVEAYTN
jgi:hypothetical protein